MPPEKLPEPWRSFLSEIDRLATAALELHCIGGFVVSLRYGLGRPTGDIDIVEVRPAEAKPWLTATAGLGSALYKKHKVYVQVVTVASIPESYESRLTELFVGRFKRLRLFVPDPYDLALSKLTRNSDIDADDVKHLAAACELDLDVLKSRYESELRSIVIGPVDRHDRTLQLWIDAINEERKTASKPSGPL
jgi:hypothetical protein